MQVAAEAAEYPVDQQPASEVCFPTVSLSPLLLLEQQSLFADLEEDEGRVSVKGFTFLLPEGAGLPHFFQHWSKQSFGGVIWCVHHLCLLTVTQA